MSRALLRGFDVLCGTSAPGLVRSGIAPAWFLSRKFVDLVSVEPA